MNNLVEAKFKDKSGNIIEVYHHSEGKTGVYMKPHQPKIFEVETESFVYAFEKRGYELIEITRQVKERELGNADEAYQVTKFVNGRVVKHD